MDREWLQRNRMEHLGRSLRLAYQEPLHLVRGEGQYVFDAHGRRYLDLVNNVCHVGHCHPRVVEAAHRQMSLLNTNTHYLHENIVQYAGRLSGLLPDPLSVCYFVNSGSEANDLALRLLWAATGRKDLVVVEGGYHGHLSSLVEISPCTYAGPDGAGAPPHVHEVPMPDGYRGSLKGFGREVGRGYGRHVAEVVERCRGEGREVAGFICESILSCGGQVVLPQGYLESSYWPVRETGGFCIADEVQVGFGRVGLQYWGFQLQGVVPDVVTMGKPIGNGHPLGAVVTTPALAESFHPGMEYFNTFGGNPVSCAVGLAVLDVIEEERLQEKALHLGERLMNGLRDLQDRHRWIGDVRGAGLFVGVELVRDRESLEPAVKEAAFIVERMKDRGFLLSRDGPWHNVLKIKPPMVLTTEDVDSVLTAMDEVLRET